MFANHLLPRVRKHGAYTCCARTLETRFACLQVRAHSLYQSLIRQGQQSAGIVEVSSYHTALGIFVLILEAQRTPVLCVLWLCVV